VGLMLEEHRGEIAADWRRAAEAELPGEPVLGFAVAPLLREMALALRGDTPVLRPGPDGISRCSVLVRSSASPARVAREMKLLHRALWEALRRAGRAVSPNERRAADEWLDDALAASLERLERVRVRSELLEAPEVALRKGSERALLEEAEALCADPSPASPGPGKGQRPPPLHRPPPVLHRPPPLPTARPPGPPPLPTARPAGAPPLPADPIVSGR